MTFLQALGNIGEFLGAIGVIVSLVYVARQMIDNTRSVKASSFNRMVQNSVQLLEHVFTDPEFAAFVDRAERDPEGLTSAERLRWDAYMTAVFRHFGNLVYQHKVGAMSAPMWESYRRTLVDDLRTPSWADWYRSHSHLFSKTLTDEVDKALAEINGSGGPG